MQEGRDRFAGRMGGLRGGAGMSLPVREQRALRGIEAGIWSSDPGLASWMAFFSRLTADEDMPGHERGPLAIVRICVMVWVAAAAAVCAVARAAGACLRAATAPVLWSGPYRSLDSRHTSPVVGAAWYSYRYHGPPRFHLPMMEPAVYGAQHCPCSGRSVTSRTGTDTPVGSVVVIATKVRHPMRSGPPRTPTGHAGSGQDRY